MNLEAPGSSPTPSGAVGGPGVSSFTIRLARPSDAGELAAVAAATFPLACPPSTTAEAMADFIARHLSADRFAGYLADDSRRILVGEADGRLVGYTLLVLPGPDGIATEDADVARLVRVRPAAELSKVYMLPEAHGGGRAQALMAATIQEARDVGAASVWLGVNQQNVRANRFYEKCGFALAGTGRFLVGEVWEDDYVRVMSLSSR